MSTQAQIEANRLNALKSTGPKTDEGKSKSSQNALKHGLTSHSRTLLPGESPADFAAFSTALRDDLKPASVLQEVIADRLIDIAWRLRRIPSAEAQVLQQLDTQRQKRYAKRCTDIQDRWLGYGKSRGEPRPQPDPLPDFDAAQAVGEAFATCPDSDNPLARLQRYEATLQRSFDRALQQLRQLKKVTSTISAVPPPPHVQNEPSSPAPQPESQAGPSLTPPVQNEPIFASPEPPAPSPVAPAVQDESRRPHCCTSNLPVIPGLQLNG